MTHYHATSELLALPSSRVAKGNPWVPPFLVIDNTGLSSRASSSQMLPFDVLAIILAAIPRHPQLANIARPLDAVALVCRHWRAVALDLPHLWSDIILFDTTRPSELARWLHRSKDASLRLAIVGTRDRESTQGPCNHLPVTVRMLCEHANRIEDLGISRLNLGDTLAILSAFSEVSTPQLRGLDVRPVAGSQELEDLLDGLLHMKLFGGRIQGIQRLSISDFEFPITSYSDLRTLRLTGQANLPPTDILTVLTRSPELEVLYLDFPLVALSWLEDTRYPTKPIELPTLRLLRLRASQPQVLHMLAHIAFPLTTRVELTLEQRTCIHGRTVVDEYQDEDIEPGYQGTGDFGRDPLPHCHSLHALSSTIEELALDYTDQTDEYFVVKFSSATGNLHVSWRWDAFTDFTYGGIWYGLVPLPAVKRLKVENIPFAHAISQVEWRIFLGLMPSLQTIEIASTVVFFDERCYGVAPDIWDKDSIFHPLFLALSRPTLDPIARGVWRLPCPSLQSVNFSHDSWGPLDLTTAVNLERCNECRRENGAKEIITTNLVSKTLDTSLT